MIGDRGRITWIMIASLAPALAAIGQTQIWIHQLGSGGDDSAAALGSDGACGAFFAISVNGGIGPVASPDIVLKRFDGAGDQAWTHLIGTTDPDYANALAPDGADGTFVTGSTWGDFGGPNVGSYDVWLARFDGAGIQIWIRQFGTPDYERPSSLAPDDTGGVYIAGMTAGRIGGPSAGGVDAWLARYDGAGDRVWIRQFGSPGAEWAHTIAPDSAGGAYVAGETTGSLGAPNAGSADVWLARYDPTGSHVWVRQFGTGTWEKALALAPDGDGGTFVAGVTAGSLAAPNHGPPDTTDAWLARYNSAGNQSWVRQFGTSNSDVATDLASDGAGGAYLAGYTYGSLAAPNPGPPDTSDAWLARYDGAGNQIEIRQFGTSKKDFAWHLATDGMGGAFAAGDTTGDLGGPNAGPVNTHDSWLARFGPGFVDCWADCNTDDALTVADFGCFQSEFVLGDPYADCDANGVLTLADFRCFKTRFVAGCP